MGCAGPRGEWGEVSSIRCSRVLSAFFYPIFYLFVSQHVLYPYGASMGPF